MKFSVCSWMEVCWFRRLLVVLMEIELIESNSSALQQVL